MIIEKSIVDGCRSDLEMDNFVAENELTVTITLNEYRNLVKTSVENKQRKEHENWFEQYSRANAAENRVKELEKEVADLRKKVADLCLKAEAAEDVE